MIVGSILMIDGLTSLQFIKFQSDSVCLKLRCCLHVLNPLFLRLEFLFGAFPFQLAIQVSNLSWLLLRGPWPWLFQTLQVGQSTIVVDPWNSLEIAMDPWILLEISQSCFFNTPEGSSNWGKNPIVVKHLHSSAGYILFIWVCLKIWYPKTAMVIRKVATKQWMFRAFLSHRIHVWYIC